MREHEEKKAEGFIGEFVDELKITPKPHPAPDPKPLDDPGDGDGGDGGIAPPPGGPGQPPPGE